MAWPIFYGAPILALFRHQGQFTRSERRDLISEKPKPPPNLSRGEAVAPIVAPGQLPVADLPAGLHTRARPRAPSRSLIPSTDGFGMSVKGALSET
mmetsp:Transcript_47556/g.74142  ORF Transcript_47556/g.74142 Transcript_47556/m.74142 type:complete len:96 (+) Transcript_47556:2-289(+)